jgi:hypothetical protein
MKMLNCYFCKGELYKPGKIASGILRCEPCQSKYDLESVITTFDVNTFEAMYAHIFIYSDDLYGKIYQIQLTLDENCTLIIDDAISNKPLLKLPGFPITPQNAKEKLKLYLTFS